MASATPGTLAPHGPCRGCSRGVFLPFPWPRLKAQLSPVASFPSRSQKGSGHRSSALGGTLGLPGMEEPGIEGP